MQSDYKESQAKKVLACEFIVPENGDYISVALEGVHGIEGAYCVAEIDDELRPFPERAPSFRANQWEHRVMGVNKNNTYFLPLRQTDSGKKIKIFTLLCNENCLDVVPNVYMCFKKC